MKLLKLNAFLVSHAQHAVLHFYVWTLLWKAINISYTTFRPLLCIFWMSCLK